MIDMFLKFTFDRLIKKKLLRLHPHHTKEKNQNQLSTKNLYKMLTTLFYDFQINFWQKKSQKKSQKKCENWMVTKIRKYITFESQ